MSGLPWLRIKEALAQILEASPAQREEILAQFAATPGLRTEVLSLLEAHESASGALTDTLRATEEVGIVISPQIAAGTVIGKYRVVRLIDSGGMGSVYESFDTVLNRAVALKVLHSSLPSVSMRQRFDDESRLLARLRHPAIAQIFDSGTYRAELAGPITPYFAMELVHDAKPIDRWIHTSTPSRSEILRTFIVVCDAVQHGHQRSIVHRDIKPANILIDASGAPKVIDFGVAQAVEESGRESARSSGRQLVGTLRYMSPEACSGDPLDVDVRADVYSLGVVLYELLSGDVPHNVETGSLLDSVRIIRETPARPVSTHDSSLAGDLECIVHKALAKDRELRYQSVADFAADIHRFLHSQPIMARPPRRLYQLRLFALRNRLAVIAATLVVLALFIGVLGLSFGLSRANRARQEALIQSQRALRTSEFLINTLRSSNPTQTMQGKPLSDPEFFPEQATSGWGFAGRPGEPVTARDMISLAADKLTGEFHDDPILRAEVMTLLADSLRETGLDPRTQSLSDQALELNRAALGAFDRRTIISELVCAHEAWLKTSPDRFIQHRKNAYESSLAAYGPLDSLTRVCTARYAEAIHEAARDHVEACRLLAGQFERVKARFGSLSREAIVERVRLAPLLSDSDQALTMLREARTLLESQGETNSLLWSETTLRIARVLDSRCATQSEAIAHYLQVRAAFDSLAYPRNARSIEVAGNLITCYLRIGKVELAVPLSRELLEAAQGRYPPGTIGSFISKGRYARILVEAGQDLELAESYAAQSAMGVDAVDPLTSGDWAVYFTAVRAQALRKLGRPADALASLDIRIGRVGARLEPAWALGFLHNERALALEALGRIDDARKEGQIALRAVELDTADALDQCHPVHRAIRETADRLHVDTATAN